MRGSHRTFLALLLSTSVIACTGSQGSTGSTGPGGPPGSPAPTTGIVAGAVTDPVAAGHPALANVAVTAADSGGTTLASGSSDASGRISLTVPVGVVYL